MRLSEAVSSWGFNKDRREKSEQPSSAIIDWREEYYSYNDRNNPSSNPHVKLEHFVHDKFDLLNVELSDSDNVILGTGINTLALRANLEVDNVTKQVALLVPNTTSKISDESKFDSYLSIMQQGECLRALSGHDNIPDFYAFGTFNAEFRFGELFSKTHTMPHFGVAMELVEGDSAQERLFNAGESFTFDQSASICKQVSSVLSYAHEIKDVYGHPFVHGDINPVNVLLEEGTNKVYVIDWGLTGNISSRNAGHLDRVLPVSDLNHRSIIGLSKEVRPAGTLAPEILSGEGEITPKADTYSKRDFSLLSFIRSASFFIFSKRIFKYAHTAWYC